MVWHTALGLNSHNVSRKWSSNSSKSCCCCRFLSAHQHREPTAADEEKRSPSSCLLSCLQLKCCKLKPNRMSCCLAPTSECAVNMLSLFILPLCQTELKLCFVLEAGSPQEMLQPALAFSVGYKWDALGKKKCADFSSSLQGSKYLAGLTERASGKFVALQQTTSRTKGLKEGFTFNIHELSCLFLFFFIL